jgi:hypothetical protein
MGSIYGVTVTSAIVQNFLAFGLPGALGDAATGEVRSDAPLGSSLALSANNVLQLIEKLRRSVFALEELPVELQAAVREVYSKALLVAFGASSAFALLAFIFSWAHRTEAMKS